MKRNIIFIISALTLLFTFACEEVIEVDLPEVEAKMVIEGEINSNLPAMVILSRNMNYFDVIDSAALSNMYITDSNAIIVVSDGITLDTLSLQTITKFPYQAFIGNKLLGEEGTSYTLNVSYQDKEYFATTSIPSSVPYSQVWFEPQLNNDSIGNLNFSFFDDANTDNYYLVSSLTIGTQWWWYKPAYGVPVFDDIFFNGDSTIVSVSKGYEGNDFFQIDVETDEERDSVLYFSIGDNVSLRLSSMDQDFYLWWNSYYRSEFTGSNPYSNPSAVLTNIEGDPALGVWGGYANALANIHITDSGTIEELTAEDILPLILPDSISDFFNN